MFKNLLLLIGVFISVSIFAQSKKIDEILNQSLSHTGKYKYKKRNYSIFLKFKFNDSEIINTSDYEKIRNTTIIKIRYHYTSYKKNKSFNQKKLDRKRLKNLYKLDNKLFKNPLIKWSVISQDSCKSVEDSNNFSHGFEIIYIAEQDDFDAEKDITTMKTILDKIKIPKKKIHDTSLDSIEYTVPVLDWRDYDDVFFTPSYMSYTSGHTDTAVISVLDRNKHWKNALVITDLTGSLSPYATHLLIWLKLNENIKSVKYVIFFNDGDSKPTGEKIVGITGGVYKCEVDKFSSVEDLAELTMRSGGGGDIPENDIEALLYGIKEFNDYDEIILIADNFANMRDFELISQINKPVRVVICGGWGLINTQYLELARRTKGSIHTMESDIENLMNMSENETIIINKQKYIIKNGKFELFNNL